MIYTYQHTSTTRQSLGGGLGASVAVSLPEKEYFKKPFGANENHELPLWDSANWFL